MLRFMRSRSLVGLFCAVILLPGGGCETSMGGAGLPIPGPEGPAGAPGPAGAQGIEGPQGPPGSDASVMAGAGIEVNAGVVALDTLFTDGLYWKQGGNDGTDAAMDFMGTTDDQPMEFRANNRRGMRLEHVERFVPGAPDRTYRAMNLVMGLDANVIDPGVIGATVSGGFEFEELDVVTTVENRISADYGTIGGGYGNTVKTRVVGMQQVGQASTIGGGSGNATDENFAFIGGGVSNQANGGVSVIAGGQQNEVSGNYGSILGGAGNEATTLATVCGGQSHDALGQFSFVGGGSNNDTLGSGASILGGFDNIANGEAATVAGGRSNRANGAHSFAAGYNAQANHSGSFVWADPGRGAVTTPSYGSNQFFVATSGGVRLTRANSLSGLSTTTTNAAVMVEKLDGGGEALWIRQRLSEDTIPVIKVHRSPSGDNDFVQGLDWSPPNNPVQKFHINKNGTFVAGSDFAEALPIVGDRAAYEPGDVVVVSTGEVGCVEKCRATSDTRVAGVYSTRPGVLGAEKPGGQTRVDAEDIPVAIVGIVPTKVCAENGPIAPGDLLVTSSTAGHAMKARPVMIDGVAIYPTGAILGKALEPLKTGRGKIRVLVSLR